MDKSPIDVVVGRQKEMKQGIYVYHDPSYAELDIVAVPGLGGNPEESWVWPPKDAVSTEEQKAQQSKASFNWLSDSDGLKKLLPKARIMLYTYASAWQGPLRVPATMESLATVLLDGVQVHRESFQERGRPIIFVGHSMGGLVVAKALCLSDTYRDQYPGLFACVTGCIFFGTPFKGTEMAKVAAWCGWAMEHLGKQWHSSLIELMRTEKNDQLEELTHLFVRLCGRESPRIALACFYELLPTDWDKIANRVVGRNRLADGFGKLARDAAPQSLQMFVEKSSAVLGEATSSGLQSNHSDLVRFRSLSDPKFDSVRKALTSLAIDAPRNARRREMAARQPVSQLVINKVRLLLEGENMRQKRRALQQDRIPTSWLVDNPSYTAWRDAPHNQKMLWIRGSAGVGKTTAALAVVNDIEKRNDVSYIRSTPSRSPRLLAYFTCDLVPGFSTAVDLLKSIILQLIDQDYALSAHAKQFLSASIYRGSADGTGSGQDARATLNVDNLWQCLQDVLTNDTLDKVYLLIANIHNLEVSAPTARLIHLLQLEVDETSDTIAAIDQPKHSRWFVTTGTEDRTAPPRQSKSVCLFDLNSSSHRDKLRDTLKKHAKIEVEKLGRERRYSPAFISVVRAAILNKAPNTKWIDIMCILLREMQANARAGKIKHRIQTASEHSVERLVEEAWKNVLERHAEDLGDIQDILKALVIAQEDLHIAELDVLVNSRDRSRVEDLVQKCAPLLRINGPGPHGGKVTFADWELKAYLTSHFERLLSATNAERKSAELAGCHTEMGLYCFEYTLEVVGRPDATPFSPPLYQDDYGAGSGSEDSDTDTESNDYFREESTSNRSETTLADTTLRPRIYPLTHWAYHIVKGQSTDAEDLYSSSTEFWQAQSQIRNNWLEVYGSKTPEFASLNTKGMTALHVAAAIGFRPLVSLILGKDPQQRDSLTDSGYTPLHVAAFRNQAAVVDVLLASKADLEIGSSDWGTPLHVAATRGHVEIMEKLIRHGANLLATRKQVGPVINAAIQSGTIEAVELILKQREVFEDTDTEYLPPLSLSARLSEPKLFAQILDKGAEIWKQRPRKINEALIEAAYSGRLESIKALLTFYTNYKPVALQYAVREAAREDNWSCVDLLIEFARNHGYRSLDLSGPFYLAATTFEKRDEELKRIWKTPQLPLDRAVLNAALYQASDNEKTETVAWLLQECRASPDAVDDVPTSLEVLGRKSDHNYGNALSAAAFDGNIDLVRLLLDNKARINHEDDYSLQLAAKQGYVDVVTTLIDCGAKVDRIVPNNLNLSFDYGTAIQAACVCSRPEIVDILLSHNADPNLGSGLYERPIIAAVAKAQEDILHLLLANDRTSVDVIGGPDQISILAYAAVNMDEKNVCLLLDKGARADVVESNGESALTMAAAKGKADCVACLCDAGADLVFQNKHDKTAIQIAAENGHLDCVRILADKMTLRLQHLVAPHSDTSSVPAMNMVISDQLLQMTDSMEMQAREVRKLRERFESFEHLQLRKDSMSLASSPATPALSDDFNISKQPSISQKRRDDLRARASVDEKRLQTLQADHVQLRNRLDQAEERLRNESSRAEAAEHRVADLLSNHDAVVMRLKSGLREEQEKTQQYAARAKAAEDEKREASLAHRQDIAISEGELQVLREEIESLKGYPASPRVSTSSRPGSSRRRSDDGNISPGADSRLPQSALGADHRMPQPGSGADNSMPHPSPVASPGFPPPPPQPTPPPPPPRKEDVEDPKTNHRPSVSGKERSRRSRWSQSLESVSEQVGKYTEKGIVKTEEYLAELERKRAASDADKR